MIIRTRNRGEVERRFALTDMVRYGYNGLRSTQMSYSEDAVRGIPAIHRAARLRAEQLACLRLRCWRGEGVDRERVDNVWQARLFRGAPNEQQTRFSFWETVGESLAYRGNSFIWKLVDPLNLRVIEMFALHPDQVRCENGTYTVQVDEGFVDPIGRGKAKYVGLTDDAILHIRGHGQGGMLEAPSPIQVFRESMSSPIARQRHEKRMWTRGAALQVAIEFPPGIAQEQAEEWKAGWRAGYEGTEGSTTPVIGGGGQIKPIGMTPADALFADMAKLTVHDASLIMGVPANLLGVQTEKAVPNLEQDLQMWLRFGEGPDLERIESALMSDDELFGDAPPNAASVYPGFDTADFVRGDLLTEAQILQTDVQSGILTPDEARAIKGYPPHPDGVGAIPQITPVGGAPNPNLNGQAVAASTSGNGSGEGY